VDYTRRPRRAASHKWWIGSSARAPQATCWSSLMRVASSFGASVLNTCDSTFLSDSWRCSHTTPVASAQDAVDDALVYLTGPLLLASEGADDLERSGENWHGPLQ